MAGEHIQMLNDIVQTAMIIMLALSGLRLEKKVEKLEGK